MRRIALAAAALALTAVAGEASAQSQSVTFSVEPINQMTVSGNPGALTINAATVGSGLTSATDASTTWGITTNQTGTKVTASIEEAMPAGVTLKVQLGAPTNATSANVTLGTTAADVVTGITKLDETGKTITYTLSATAAAGVVASASRTVTYTVVAGS
ncbi:MAG TPA: hypothetical protein VF613_16640 [Longimicrobium sp.]|jgi:hypothetical protein